MRKLNVIGYRVVVEVPKPWAYDNDEAKRLRRWREAAESIARGIKRHIDDIGQVYADEESEPVCSFCGREWTEAPNSPHNGGCCDEDCANMPSDAPVSP